jgi:hypothetical protein
MYEFCLPDVDVGEKGVRNVKFMLVKCEHCRVSMFAK